MEKSKYELLASINVNEHIEKKNGLSYLSWAWAVDQLLRNDPNASWEYKEPVKWGDTVMVFCTVTAFGKAMTAQLPVMDYNNKSIPNPDSFAVNTAMQRCLAKAIALHGLGLYIYAGEDLPADDKPAIDIDYICNEIRGASSLEELKRLFKSACDLVGTDKGMIAFVISAKDARKAELEKQNGS